MDWSKPCADPENVLGGGGGVQFQTRMVPTKFYHFKTIPWKMEALDPR